MTPCAIGANKQKIKWDAIVEGVNQREKYRSKVMETLSKTLEENNLVDENFDSKNNFVSIVTLYSLGLQQLKEIKRAKIIQ